MNFLDKYKYHNDDPEEFGIELNSEPNLRKIDKLKHIAVIKISCK